MTFSGKLSRLRTKDNSPKLWSFPSSYVGGALTRLAWNSCIVAHVSFRPLSHFSKSLRCKTGHAPTFKIEISEKSLLIGSSALHHHSHLHQSGTLTTYSCANHAAVTAPSLSLNSPNPLAVELTTTTAFCTVDLVTSADLRFNLSERIWRVQAMPKRLVDVLVILGLFEVASASTFASDGSGAGGCTPSGLSSKVK